MVPVQACPPRLYRDRLGFPTKSGFKVGQARQTRLPSGGQAYGGQGQTRNL